MSLNRQKGRIFAALLISFTLVFSALPLKAAAPTVSMLGVEGLVKMVTEDGAGKVVIISVMASWCPPCREEMPMLVQTRKLVSEDDLLIIGVSVDESVKALNGFLKEYEVNFDVYTATGELVEALGIGPIPHTFIFNRKGELVESVVGLIPEPLFRAALARLLSEPGN